jgi:sugar phosphate isomerase/epimerase
VKLGLVNHNPARAWDLSTTFRSREATGFRRAKARTSHARGVEAALDAAAWRRVGMLFAESSVVLVGLGTVLEFHSLDPGAVRRNVEGAKAHLRLASDVGAAGVKVRPNGHQKAAGVSRDTTLEQIGLALRECGVEASSLGVEIGLERHGAISEARDIRRTVEAAEHPSVGACCKLGDDERG